MRGKRIPSIFFPIVVSCILYGCSEEEAEIAGKEAGTVIEVETTANEMSAAEPKIENLSTLMEVVIAGLVRASASKTAVVEFYTAMGRMPSSNEEAKVAPSKRITSPYVDSVEVSKGGLVTVTYNGEIPFAGDTIVLRPDLTRYNGIVFWVCDGGTLSNEHRPESCKRPEPDGSSGDPSDLTPAAQAIARDLLTAYNNDRGRLDLVAGHADYAVLAWAAYEDGDALKLAKERGWTPLQSIANKNLLSGHTAATLFTSKNGAQVIAFRGTDPGVIGDLVTDTLGSVDITPLTTGQLAGAREIAEQYKDATFVGHSLGGRLAQIAHLETGRPAVGFNSAPLGAYELTQYPTGSQKMSGKLLRFCSPDDPITVTDRARNIEVSNIQQPEGGALAKVVSLGYKHSVAVIAGAMQEVRIARDEGWIAAYLAENK